MIHVAIGADHAGFDLKKKIIDFLRLKNFSVTDVGTYDEAPVDFPDYVEKLSSVILLEKNCLGIMICGSGIGSCIAANKITGIRAGICSDTYSAHQGVEHNNMNIMVLGSRVIGVELAKEIVLSFLFSIFKPEDRFIRRLDKISKIESRKN